jgi:hypothetical protein
MAGYNGCEDIGKALQASSLNNEYWDTKRIYAENVKIPMYLTASYSYDICNTLRHMLD